MNVIEPQSIVLAGRDWPVPRLAPKQNRIVVPALLELIPKILGARAESDAAGDDGAPSQIPLYLDTAFYDRLTDMVFAALTRGTPELSRDEFDTLPIDTLELLLSVRVIARQAGLLKKPA
ncbi:MAG TPA: hypothetical protein VGI20_10985 [Rhizomicrobium sp.]|jgi:hypothetical protein